MALFKYVNTNTLKHILGGQIRFTQPSAFNDPFELLPEIYHPPEIKPKKVDIHFSLDSPRRDLAHFEPPMGYDPKFCNDIVSRSIVENLDEQIGILCLTKNHNSLLMWAHYADDYKGAIIKFDDEHDFFENLIDVKYEKERPKISASYYTEAKNAIPISELCVKSEEWEYEKERRLIRLLSDCVKVGNVNEYDVFVQNIPLAAIKSVNLGERMPSNEQREIWEMLKRTHVSVVYN